MSATAWVQLVLALLKLTNWATTQISRAQWEASGSAKAIAAQQTAIAHNVGIASQIYHDTAGKTDEQLNRDLME